MQRCLRAERTKKEKPPICHNRLVFGYFMRGCQGWCGNLGRGVLDCALLEPHAQSLIGDEQGVG